jgi:amino acid transporter
MDRSIFIAVLGGLGIGVAVLALCYWVVVVWLFPAPDGDDPLRQWPKSSLRSLDPFEPAPRLTEPQVFVVA